MAYNPSRSVFENEGGYTDWSGFDPNAAAAAGMSPMDILRMAQQAGLGTSGSVFGGSNDIPSQQARNLFSSSWFQGLDPSTQQQLTQAYQSTHSDNGWGAFLGGLGMVAAPFAANYLMTGESGLGGLFGSATSSAVPTSTVTAGDLGTGLTPGASFGLTAPTAPTVAGMGGTGLTTTAAGGGVLGAGGVAAPGFGASLLAPDLTGVAGLGALGAIGSASTLGDSLGSSLGSSLGGFLGGGNDPTGGGIFGSGLDLATRELPGLLALDYASRQSGPDLTNLNGILGGLQGNQNAIIKAATDPLQMNIAAGYGDLLQNQGLRGIRGSSFGNTDIANYLSSTGNALANAGANAAQGSLALQGNLAAQIAELQNQAQQQKNLLYGNAFDTLGRGLNPQGYAANLGIPGTTTTSGSNPLGTFLAGLGGKVGSTVGGLFA